MLATHGLRRAARVRGDFPGIEFEGVTRSWATVEDRVARVAAGLRALGLQRGDRVAVLSENSGAFFEIYWAAPWADLIMASLNTRWAVPEMIAALQDCGASALVVDAAFAPLAEQLVKACPSVRHVIYAGSDAAAAPSGARDYEALVAENAPLADQERGGSEVVHLFYTSGTTGQSKGAMLTSDNVFFAGLMIASPFALSAHTNALCVMPMFHVGAGTFLVGLTFAASGIVIARRFDAADALKTIAERRITHSVLVPAMINQMLNAPKVESYDLTCMERLIYGASPMPPALLNRAMEKMPGVGFNQGYSMTETTATGACLLPQDHQPDGPFAHRMHSVGQPIAGNDLEIRDPSGKVLPPCEVGEVCIRGPGLMAGYWNKPAETAAAVKDGWLHTGDAGKLDADGYLYIVDRIKDMIITGGENVYSAEVENAIFAHPSVAECAVIGLPDEKWGERVTAILHLKPESALTESDLIAHCRTMIGGYKVPRQVIFSADPLPRSGTGKILKPLLRQIHANAGN